jgi:hypothetical protein
MHRLRASFVLVVLIATLLVAPPARALEKPGWLTVPCATGAMTTAPVEAADELWVTGWIQPCTATPLNLLAAFAVISYTATYGYPGRGMPYQEVAAPTPFAGQLDLHRYGTHLRAVCLAFSPTRRLACLGIDYPEGLPIATPIATDDPRVTLPLSTIPFPPQDTSSPFCGTCV